MVDDEMDRLLHAAIAPNTHKTYLAGWRAFCQFRQQHPGGPWASVDDVRHFVAWLSLRGLASATIATYVSGLGYYQKLNGQVDPTSDFLVCKLIEGARRVRPSIDCRVPISLPILDRIISVLVHICSSQYESVMFRAVFLSAFFGFMRVGEFAVYSKNNIQSSVLTFTDIRFVPVDAQTVSVDIVFRHAKNNQRGPPQTIRLVQSQNAALCPVRALQDFAAIRPRVDGPFFCHFNTGPLTRYQFNAVLQKAVRFADLTDYHIRGHSFRIGAASSAFGLGVPQSNICQMGRWRSRAFLSYVRPVPVCNFTNHDKSSG